MKQTDIYNRKKTHKTIQKHRIHKTENKYTKQENKHKSNIKNQSQVIAKKTNRSK